MNTPIENNKIIAASAATTTITSVTIVSSSSGVSGDSVVDHVAVCLVTVIRHKIQLYIFINVEFENSICFVI